MEDMAPQSHRRTSSAKPPRRRRIAKPSPLHCELLEDRTTPALFNVQNPLSVSGLNNNGCVAVADLNKDGFTDAILTNFGTDYAAGAGNTITVLYGKSGGGFNRVTLDTGGKNVSFVSIGDINGDTWPDAVVVNANQQNEGSVTVFQNDQLGNLSQPPTGSPFGTGGNNSSWVGLADVTGDAIPDVIVGSFGKADASGQNFTGNNITIFQGHDGGNGKGDFTFTSSNTLTEGLAFVPTALAVADFNGDGINDIAAVVPGVPPDFGQPYPEGSIYVFKGTGSGGFGSASQYDSGGVFPVNIQAEDLNGDGKKDLIVANAGDPNSSPEFNSDSVGVLLNASTSSTPNFGVPTALTANTYGTFAVAVADFDLDGKMDIAAVNYGAQLFPPPAAFVSVYMGNGTGTFTPGSPGTYDTLTNTGGGQYLAIGDFDSNGTPDLIVAHASNKLGMLLNTSTPPVLASTLAIAGPTSMTAGVAQNFTVTAKDGSGNTATGYRGTVHFTSSDGQAILPANYTFTAADNGVHTFTITLKTAGSQAVTVTDTLTSSITGTQSGITVTAAAASTFSFAMPVGATAGAAFNATVTAKDAFGNTASGYTGTVHLTSSDGQAVLPSDYTFIGTDNGVHIFPVTLKTAGSQTVTATDTNNGSINGNGSITVFATGASTLAVTMPANATAGTTFNASVTAKDAFGNTATGYAGTVHFTSSDGQAVLPSDYTFIGTDNGTHIFPITLKTSGTQSITVTDTTTGSITGNASTTVSVSASAFTVDGFPSTTTAGVAESFTVTAKDAFGNTVSGYTGTVHFTSSDGQAVLPADYTFIAADNGVHTFSATLKTAGTQSITATDTNTSSITGNQPGITVTPSAAASFVLTGLPAGVTAGAVQNITVAAKDAFGNTATGYSGTVHFTSTDGLAVLPANYTFVGGDNGTHTFPITLNTVGNQSVTATDTINGAITGSVSTTVSLAQATHLQVAAPSTVTIGASFTVTVTALDAANAVATGYRGTVHFTSSDGLAVLPANYTFLASDNGSHTFTVTLNTLGNQTVTATDTVTGSITGNSTITVSAVPPPPPQPFAVGTARGPVATVRMYNPDGTTQFTKQPFGSGYTMGVRVAVGDVTGDGIPDVVVATNGGIAARAQVIDGNTQLVLSNNLLGNMAYTGKVSVAVGDVNGDGVDDIVLGMNRNGPLVRVYRGGDFVKLAGFRAGPSTDFLGGTTVALGDMNNDGKAEVVVSSLYSGFSRIAGFNGASIAPGVQREKVFNKLTLRGAYVNGLFLAVGDVNDDGRADLVLGSPGSKKPTVNVFSGQALVDSNTRTKIASFTPANSTSKGGVRVGVREINGDGQLDIITASGVMISAFEGGSSLPLTGLPPVLFAFDPPDITGSIFVG